MILRRFMKHITEQNWFAVWLDVIVVVVGIFLGMQVTAWNAARADRAEEARILDALKIDTQNAIALRQDELENMVDMRANIAAALKALFEIQPAETLSKNQCLAIGQSHIITWSPINLVSVDELLAAGKLGLLRDTSLRTLLLAFRGRAIGLDSLNSETGQQANVLVDQFPHLLPRSFTADDVIWTIDCQFSTMKTDQAFLNSLQSNYGRSSGTVESLQIQLDQLRTIEARLNEAHE